MTSHLNNNANMPWVWSVAQRLEQQPRKLKMWGSIPYHAHHYAYDSKAKYFKNYRGLLLLLVMVCCSCTIKSTGDEDSLIRLLTRI